VAFDARNKEEADMWNRAVAAETKGDLKQAVSLLKSLCQSNPKQLYYHLQLLDVYLKTGDLPQALEIGNKSTSV
jgi:predicted Zn-dependent protease